MSLLNPQHLLAPFTNKKYRSIIIGAVLIIGVFRWMGGTSVDGDPDLESVTDYSQSYLSGSLTQDENQKLDAPDVVERRSQRDYDEEGEESVTNENSINEDVAPLGKLNLSDIEKEMGL